jgi:hypothetical protein
VNARPATGDVWESTPGPLTVWKRYLVRAKPEQLFLGAVVLYGVAALAGWLAGLAPNMPNTTWVNGYQQDASIYGGSWVQVALVSLSAMVRYYAIAQIAWSIGRVIGDAVRESGRDQTGTAKDNK